MALMRVVGELDKLDDALQRCCESGEFHIETPPLSKGFSVLKEENPYTAMLDKLGSVSGCLSHKFSRAEYEDVSSGNLDSDLAYIEEIEAAARKYSEISTELNTEYTSYKNSLVQLKHLSGLDVNIKELFTCESIRVRYGKLPKDSFRNLSYYSDELFLFIPFDDDDDYYWGLYAMPSESENEIDDIFSSLYFEQIEVPDYLFETGSKAVEGIKKLLETTEEEQEKLSLKIKELESANSEKLDKLYSLYSDKSSAFELRKKAVISGDKFHIIGFVPAKKAEKTVKSLNEIKGITAIETPNDADARLKPPTRLKNNFLVRPFELIVKMYGLPRYGDIDPTVYVAITYTLLFGAMFGDVGQGLVVFLAGLVMAHILKMDFGKILERIGLSSTMFGFLYGSVFGFEHLLDPFYKAVFGLEEKPIEVFEQSNTLLLTAIAIGAVLISVSIILNIILSFRHKNLEEAVFGNNGVAGFIFYASLLAALALRFLFRVNVLNPFYIFFLIVLPLLLIFFKQPLGKLISGKKKIAPENGIGEFIAENFFEMFEYLLSYATNTMSFLRVGGFVLSHAGMMLVVFSLAEMFQATGSVIVIIIGNIFVMGMEGLIVGIQALRLQFYEVFGRFFVADGKEFIPVSAKKSDK